MKFNKFVRKHLGGLRLLNVSLEGYGPGHILDRKKLRKLGVVKEILTGTQYKWTINRSDASITYGTITGSKSLKGGASLLGIIGLSGSYANDYSADFEINGIQGSEFKFQSQLTLQPDLNQLRSKKPALWKLITDQLVVTEAFYATQFTARFKKGSSIIGKADLESKLKLNAEAELTWENEEVLQITNNQNVPFGVRGFYV